MKLYGIVFGKAFVSLEDKETKKDALGILQEKTKKIIKVVIVNDEHEALKQMGIAVRKCPHGL